MLPSRGPLGEEIPVPSQHIPNKTSRSLQNPFGAAWDQVAQGWVLQPLPKDLTYILGLGMGTGKLGSAGSRGKLGSAAFFSRKRDFLQELELPSRTNLLKQRKPRCYRKREDSWRTASAPAGIWGFCIQNHPVPTKNRERKHSQGMCSWVLAWAGATQPP